MNNQVVNFLVKKIIFEASRSNYQFLWIVQTLTVLHTEGHINYMFTPPRIYYKLNLGVIVRSVKSKFIRAISNRIYANRYCKGVSQHRASFLPVPIFA